MRGAFCVSVLLVATIAGGVFGVEAAEEAGRIAALEKRVKALELELVACAGDNGGENIGKSDVKRHVAVARGALVVGDALLQGVWGVGSELSSQAALLWGPPVRAVTNPLHEAMWNVVEGGKGLLEPIAEPLASATASISETKTRIDNVFIIGLTNLHVWFQSNPEPTKAIAKGLVTEIALFLCLATLSAIILPLNALLCAKQLSPRGLRAKKAREEAKKKKMK